jgi:hypothetical protein
MSKKRSRMRNHEPQQHDPEKTVAVEEEDRAAEEREEPCDHERCPSNRARTREPVGAYHLLY